MTMKLKYLSYAFASMLVVSTACTDMELSPEGSTVTSAEKEDILAVQPEKAEAAVNAVITSFSTDMLSWPADERHNDFGYPALMMFFEANGYDMVSSDNGYNWMGNSLDFSDRLITSYESYITWSSVYRQISAANAVVASLGLEQEEDLGKYYVAQALSVRAFSYWVLAQLYQFNYADNKSEPCVPLITDENVDQAAIDGAPRATVEEVYTQIMSDIDSAIEFLTSNSQSRSNNSFVSLEVAYGIRARVNLTMENWSAAASDATAAMAYGAPHSMSAVSVPAFNDISEFMWGIDIAETDGVVTTGICNWPSHMGSLNWGYCWYSGGMQINKELFESIPDTDVRKGWWVDADYYSANLSDYEQWFISSYVEYPIYTHVKFAPYGGVLATSTNANDVPLMRVEEMYLILAEAQAMSGNVAGGAATLQSFVQTYRDPEYTCTAASAEEVQEAVYFQRRIELWGEGLSWFDIMRLEKDVDRRGGGYPEVTSVVNIPAGSDILLWRIPEAEIQANVQISDADNNKSGTFTNYTVADYE